MFIELEVLSYTEELEDVKLESLGLDIEHEEHFNNCIINTDTIEYFLQRNEEDTEIRIYFIDGSNIVARCKYSYLANILGIYTDKEK